MRLTRTDLRGGGSFQALGLAALVACRLGEMQEQKRRAAEHEMLKRAGLLYPEAQTEEVSE